MHSLRLYVLFIKQIFSWEFLPLLGFGVVVTAILVFSEVDWQYFLFTQDIPVRPVLFLTNSLGFIIPAVVVLTFILLRLITHSRNYSLYAQLSFYAVLLGLTVSSFIKVFTGRTSPPHLPGSGDILDITNTSTHFNFGFMQESILGGWPSSHATVMFALATALYITLPKNWYVTLLLFGTALFVSIGVTFGWHWLSEFVAGACLGITIGIVVGRYFKSLVSHF